MIIALAGLSLIFVVIGYIATEKNAKYLLSGYNTMSENERNDFDLESFIPAFRKFHLILGASILVVGSALSLLISETAAGVFMAVYPIIAYIWFLVFGKKYYKGRSLKWNKIGIAILIFALIFILALLFIGFRENKIVVAAGEITIEGMYGEKISASEIETVSLTDRQRIF